MIHAKKTWKKFDSVGWNTGIPLKNEDGNIKKGMFIFEVKGDIMKIKKNLIRFVRSSYKDFEVWEKDCGLCEKHVKVKLPFGSVIIFKMLEGKYE